MQCKYSNIKQIYDWCEQYADDEAKQLIGTHASFHFIAYFTPSQANWSYQVGVLKYNNNYYECVAVFGIIRAVRLVNIPNYNTSTLKNERY